MRTGRPRKEFLVTLLIPLAALIVVWPLIRNGCSCGHDFTFHLLNWIEVAAHWQVGVLYPHWAHWAAWGAGEPRFIFYPPLSWLLGGTLGSLANLHPSLWRFVPIVYSFIVLTAAGYAAYALALTSTRMRTAHATEIIAAVFYVVNPYMMFVVYERTAYAELLAAVWIPLLLRALLADEINILGIAVPIALLWLSNAPAAVMGSYTLGLIAIIRVVLLWRTSRSWTVCAHFTKKIMSGVTLGIALAAFYIVPAAFERRWVQIENVLGGVMNPASNFLFGQTLDMLHDAVLRTVSWVVVVVIALTLIFLTVAWLRKRGGKDDLIVLSALTLATIFAVLPISLPLWNHLPQLMFLQFPWRLIAILSAAMVLAVATAFRLEKPRWLLLALVLPIVAVPLGYKFFQQSCANDDEIAMELEGKGTILHEPTDEYTPRDADGDALHLYSQHFWLTDTDDSGCLVRAGNKVSEVQYGMENFQYTAQMATPQLLVLRLWDYPAWKVTVNGNPVSKRHKRNDGMMVIPLPVGHSIIHVEYVRTADQTAGQIISTIALVIAALLMLSSKNLLTNPSANATRAATVI